MTGTATGLLDNWKKANIPAELHVFPDGGHGFGMNKKGKSCDAWTDLLSAWLKRQGGLAAMAERNERKAARLYGAIDNSNFYSSPVAVENRSWMNVPFTLPDPEMDGVFLSQAEAQGLTNLKGHRSVGGMRASIYNAVDEAAVDALVEFMVQFENEQG